MGIHFPRTFRHHVALVVVTCLCVGVLATFGSSIAEQMVGYFRVQRALNAPASIHVFGKPPIAPSTSTTFDLAARTGWPLTAFVNDFAMPNPGPRTPGLVLQPNDLGEAWLYGIRAVYTDAHGCSRHLVTIPLRPHFPGFAVDVLFYGVLTCMALHAPQLFRRRRRVQSDCCVACGYQLAGFQICAECGRDRAAGR